MVRFYNLLYVRKCVNYLVKYTRVGLIIIIIIIQNLYSARSIKIALRRFTNIPKNKCVKYNNLVRYTRVGLIIWLSIQG